MEYSLTPLLQSLQDRTDPMVLANSMFNTKLTSYNSNLYTYTAAITKIMGLHNKKYLNSTIHFAARHDFTVGNKLPSKVMLTPDFMKFTMT